MKVVSIKEQKDGSAILTLDLSKKEYTDLMIAGMQLEVGAKYKVVPIKEANKLGITGKKIYNMTDAEADEFVRSAVLDALKKGLSEVKKEKKVKAKKK